METEKKCNYPKCNNKRSEKVKMLYCRCCNKGFCNETCELEHMIVMEKEKRKELVSSIAESGVGNTLNNKNQSNKEALNLQGAETKSIFMKPGIILKKKEKNSYYDFSNFEKVKIGNKHKILGCGAFGEVYLAKNTTDNKLFAIKQIHKAKLSSVSIKPELIYREINIHTKLVHDHIVRLYNYFEDSKTFYLIVEYVENGTLFSVIQSSADGFSEEESFKYFIQVASAMNFLHENNMIHRDLKPENILLDKEGNVKLCDFGWTVETSKTRETFCGTYEYMAPEIIVEKPYNKGIDMWSLGILLYELLHSYSPFRAKSNGNYGKNEESGYKEIMKNVVNYKFKIDKNVSEECKDLLVKLLNPKMENRMTIAEVFSHPWVKQFENRLKESFKKVERTAKRSKTDKEQKNRNNLNNFEGEGDNVTVIDALQIYPKDSLLFDSVLEQVQEKSKIKRRSNSKDTKETKISKANTKIVLRAEKPNRQDLSPTVNNPFNNDDIQFQESPIKNNQSSIYNDSCFSMYKEMKEIDKEIDKKVSERMKQLENLKKNTEKMKEQITKSSTKNYSNNYRNDIGNYLKTEEEQVGKDYMNSNYNNQNSKLFENLKTQPQSFLYNTMIGEPTNSSNNKKMVSSGSNYNDLIFTSSTNNTRTSNLKTKKTSHSKRDLKQVNKDLELKKNKKQLNYSDCLDFDVTSNSNDNPLLNGSNKLPFRYANLHNKSEMSIQTDPVPNSVWGNFFGFFNTFKCGG